MKTLTIRGVSKRLADALEREKRRRGQSLNQTVLDVLDRGLGLHAAGRPRNGLGKFAGSWSSDDHAQFEANIATTERIDDEIWR